MLSQIVLLIDSDDLKDRCRKYLNTSRDIVGGDSNLSNGILLPLKDLIE